MGTPSASLAPRASARKTTARRTHQLEVARSTGIAARHTMPSASLASRASARKSSARRTHLLIFLEECKVARSTGAAAGQTTPSASLAPRAERGRVLQEEPIYWRLREVQELLPGIQCQVRVLQAGHQRGRVLQEEPIY